MRDCENGSRSAGVILNEYSDLLLVHVMMVLRFAAVHRRRVVLLFNAGTPAQAQETARNGSAIHASLLPLSCGASTRSRKPLANRGRVLTRSLRTILTACCDGDSADTISLA